MTSLDGIASLPLLSELYLSFNDVSELRALCDCEQLTTVDLEGNDVSDEYEIEPLASLTLLTSLTLAGNPLASLDGYRSLLLSTLPSLTHLDEAPRFPPPPASPHTSDSDSASELSPFPASSSPSHHTPEAMIPGRARSDESRGSAHAARVVSSSSSAPDSGESMMVLEGIKHARAGMDALSFMSLLQPPTTSASTLASRARTATTSSSASRRTTSHQSQGGGLWASRPSTASILSRPSSAATRRPLVRPPA